MKKALLFAVPFVLAFVVSTAVRAEEGGEKKAGADTKAETCAAAGKTADGKVINLTGNVAKEYKKGGDYVVKGKLSDDGKTIEVAEMKKKE
jgi:uncharacterized protein YdeI (BOF family)